VSTRCGAKAGPGAGTSADAARSAHASKPTFGLFQDVAAYVVEASRPSQVRHLLDRAMRTALGKSGVGVLVPRWP
jgi:pyruvate dehydrogenase (quinone)